MYYLVTKYTYFVDPHGTPDEGGIEKFITSDSRYKSTPEGLYEQFDEIVNEDDLRGSEDGYNSEAHVYKVRELDEIEAIAYGNIIKAYTELE